MDVHFQVKSTSFYSLGGGGGGGGGTHVARLNFKTSRVGAYKCLSLIVGLVVIVAIWPREVVSCGDSTLHAVATFWARSLVGIYPRRASSRVKFRFIIRDTVRNN